MLPGARGRNPGAEDSIEDAILSTMSQPTVGGGGHPGASPTEESDFRFGTGRGGGDGGGGDGGGDVWT